MDWQPPQPGDLFHDRFRIDALLGKGGFAHVFRATQLDLGRTVALKILKPFYQAAEPGDDGEDEWVKRFRREAQLVSRLTDPHTITMYEYGCTPEGTSYMSFEYVGGDSLDVILRREGSLAPHRVVEILRQCLHSLQEAHHLEMLHRDIKPANIMLYERLGKPNCAKVLDFGIAKPILDGDDFTNSELTQAGAILGTPRYMSPEQLKGQGICPASDLYSLGLVVFELLTGQKAVGGTTTMTIITHQLSPDAILLPVSREIPGALRQIVNRMVDKSLETRFQSAEEILAIIDRWAEISIDFIEPTLHDHVATGPGQWSTPNLLPATNPALPSLPGPAPVLASTPPRPKPTPAAPPPEKRESSIIPYIGVGAGIVAIVTISAFAMLNMDSVYDPAPELIASAYEVETPPQERAEVPAPAPEHEILIVTDPSEASLVVNGLAVGKSPANLVFKASEFPLDVVASLDDGRKLTRTLAAPTDSLSLDFPAVEVTESVEEEIVAAPVKRPATQRPRKTTPTTTAARKPEPTPVQIKPKTTKSAEPARKPTSTDSSSDQKKKKTESSFPMLDGY